MLVSNLFKGGEDKWDRDSVPLLTLRPLKNIFYLLNGSACHTDYISATENVNFVV